MTGTRGDNQQWRGQARTIQCEHSAGPASGRKHHFRPGQLRLFDGETGIGRSIGLLEWGFGGPAQTVDVEVGSEMIDQRPVTADRHDLHPNTVRFHLKILVYAGLACHRTDPRQGTFGRPRLHTATTDHSATPRQHGYQLLADILASYLAANSTMATGLPEQAGRTFAHATGDL